MKVQNFTLKVRTVEMNFGKRIDHGVKEHVIRARSGKNAVLAGKRNWCYSRRFGESSEVEAYDESGALCARGTATQQYSGRGHSLRVEARDA